MFLSILVVQTDEQRSEMLLSGGIPMGIGKNSIVRRAIVDKNARIGENVKVSCTKLLSSETRLHPYGTYIVKKNFSRGVKGCPTENQSLSYWLHLFAYSLSIHTGYTMILYKS